MAAEKSTVTSSKGQAWFCTTGLPSDVVVEVDDMTFHLHKFPLMSKSKKLHDLIKEQEAKQTPKQPRLKSRGKQQHEKQDDDSDDDDDDGDEEEGAEEQCHVSLPRFPGGSEAFEQAAKFCYGVKVEITAGRVAPLRCAGEALEMTEEYSEDNLISKTERFLSHAVLKSIRDSIKALKSCEAPSLSPAAEALGIVQRCIDAICAKAGLYDPKLFGWPVGEGPAKAARDPWAEDLAQLSSGMFIRVINSMKQQGLNPEIVESCLIYYAKRCFPGISRMNRKPSQTTPSSSEAEQRGLLEMIVSSLPPERCSRSPAVTRFLFGLLRTANILNVSDECKSAIERKVGAQLEEATLDDLLIPSYSYLNETLYDVDCVQRILGHFLDCYEERETGGGGSGGSATRSPAAIMLVGKLIDGYLSEIASDTNLKPDRFCQLALSLPEEARLYDDGVYRAVDVYLKAHPWISEEERERISGVMDCQKLTLEACTHAAQNERLPLRSVVQVLFFEQLQLRHAIAGTLITNDGVPLGSVSPSVHGMSEGAEERESALALVPVPMAAAGGGHERSTWREAVRENQVLRLDMDSMRTRVHELERECSTMKKVIEKIDRMGTPQKENGNGNGKSWRSSVSRKFGCKFKTQVCDSHESTVVEARRGRHHANQR